MVMTHNQTLMKRTLSTLTARDYVLLFIIAFLLVFKGFGIAQPAGFTDQVYLDGGNKVVGFTWDANGKMYVWEYAGKVWVVENGVKQATPLLDISEEVGGWRDFGLLGFALDPNFLSNGYVYLLYVVDRHHLLNYGTSNYNPGANEYFDATIGRITRYQADQATNFTTVIPSSRYVLFGETPATGSPILHESHGVGCLVFGEDGTLLATIGDGASYNSNDEGSASETYWAQALTDGIITPAQNIGAYRCQTLDNFSGKILRLDPMTGDGVSSNPYYNAANPRSPASRTWARGLRNPYRIALLPESGSHNPADGNPGTFFIGDVGWGTREEMDLMDAPGMNFGWPKYEGMTFQPGYNNGNYTPPTHDLPVTDWRIGTPRALVNGTIYNIGSATVPGPSFLGNASTGGTWYSGSDFPATWKSTYFHADYGGGWIRNFVFDANMQPTEVRNFISNAGACVFVGTHPTLGNLYYVRYPGQIRQVTFTGVTNRAPVAFAQADQTFGPSPMTVNFTSTNTFDQDGDPLTYLWDFGDGTTSTAPNPAHTFDSGNSNPTGYPVILTVMDNQGLTANATLGIALNNTPPTINSTSIDGVNTFDPALSTNLTLTADVTDPNHTASELSYEWKVFLHNNEHYHPVTEVMAPSGNVLLTGVECYNASYWYRITLKVTDPAGQSGFYKKNIYPACPGASQTITFPSVSDKVVTDAPFTLNATTSSGLGLTYYKMEGPVTITGNTATLTGVPGKVTIVATQPGNGTYAPAFNVYRSFWVNVNPAGGCAGTGLISRDVWTGISGNTVAQIPVNTPPNTSDQLTIFETPVDAANNYGTRVRGYICVPASGQYTFWIASDDNGELWLSTGADPTAKQLIASVPEWSGSRQWNKFAEQQSAPVTLVGGQLYYIEALQKEGTGGDNLAVGWQLPNGAMERPIPGIRLLPYGAAPPTAAFTADPVSGNAPLAVSFDASSSSDTDGSIVSYAWDFGDGASGSGVTASHTYTATGTFTATLTVTDNSGNTAAASLAIAVNGTGPQNQMIDFPAISNKLTTDAPFLISATATSGLPVGFSIVSGPATVAGNTVTLAGTAGTVIVRANQPGDANWNPAAPVDRSFMVTAQQGGGVDLEMTMSANPATLQVYNDMSFTATLQNVGTAVATGVKVHFPKPSGVVFVGGNEYIVSQGSFNLYTDLVWSVGTLAPGATATISQNYFVLQSSPLTAWAQVTAANETDVDSAPNNGTCCTAVEDDEAALTVIEAGAGPQNQTITFPAIPDKESNAAPFAISATATSGLPVSFSIVSGPATILGNTITLDGTLGTVTVRAEQPGDANWNPAPAVERSFQVTEPGLANQTITFPVISNKLTTDAPFTISAMASSGLPVTLSVLSGPATLTGTTVTLTGQTGAVIIRASQPGDAQYNPAPDVGRTFYVTEPGGSAGVDLELSMSANPTTVTQWGDIGFTATLTNVGTETATGVKVKFPKPSGVVFVGGNEYTVSKGTYSASGNRVWTVGSIAAGATETITVNWFILQNSPLTGYAQVSACTEADFDSTPDSGTCCTAVEDDEAAFTATLPGSGPQEQTITFPALPDKESTAMPFTITATASSGLLVSLSIVSGPATISGDIITLDGSLGTVTVRAEQAGDANWNPAPAVERSFAVTQPGLENQTIDFPSIPNKLTTGAPFAISATATSGLPVSFTLVSGPATLSGNMVTLDGTAGTVTIKASQAGDVQYNPAPDVLRSFAVIGPGGGGPDLEVTLTASGPTLLIWQNMTFSVAVTNAGTEAATGVTLDVPIPAGLAYTSHAIAGGTYDLFFEKWDVGTLPPGATATLDLELFVLQNSMALPYFVQVANASPADIDSSPGNNTSGTPVEDDEALVTLLPPGNPAAGTDSEVFTLLAARNGTVTKLRWVSNTGYKTLGYKVERSADGFRWELLRERANETYDNAFTTYRELDERPLPGWNFYRVKQLPDNGYAAFSNVVMLEFEENLDEINLFPNPAGQYVDVNLRAFAGLPVTLILVDWNGREVVKNVLDEAPVAPFHLELWEVPDGFYVLWIQVEGRRARALPLIIDKHY
jgi:uncharacterized repeat protein (TIGR01451 family)